jgi:putative CocE/NonD family hydrolase
MDQRPVEQRRDVLVFSTRPLEQDLEVVGPVKAVLWVATSQRDTDFTAKLVDVFPDGYARNLTDGILRLRYRNSLERPEPVRPGEVYEITLDAGIASNEFLKGHRIRVEISSSNFPRFDRNPNTGAAIAGETRLVKANQTIYHDRQHPSRLVLMAM